MNDQQDMTEQEFTHVREGKPSMVDVSEKSANKRTATAEAIVWVGEEVMSRLQGGDLYSAKGPVFQTAIIAGTMATKQTSLLIPFCHPLPLEYADVKIVTHGEKLMITCAVATTNKTGVEMEAMTGASVAALTIYDMCKAMNKKIRIESVRLLSKTGGKSGDFYAD